MGQKWKGIPDITGWNRMEKTTDTIHMKLTNQKLLACEYKEKAIASCSVLLQR